MVQRLTHRRRALATPGVREGSCNRLRPYRFLADRANPKALDFSHSIWCLRHIPCSPSPGMSRLTLVEKGTNGGNNPSLRVIFVVPSTAQYSADNDRPYTQRMLNTLVLSGVRADGGCGHTQSIWPFDRESSLFQNLWPLDRITISYQRLKDIELCLDAVHRGFHIWHARFYYRESIAIEIQGFLVGRETFLIPDEARRIGVIQNRHHSQQECCHTTNDPPLKPLELIAIYHGHPCDA